MESLWRKFKKRMNVLLVLTIVFLSIFSSFTEIFAQGPPDNPGNFNGNQQHGSQKPSRYQFGNNLSFELQAQHGVNFSISYDENVINRFFGMKINNTDNTSVKIDYLSKFEHPIKTTLRKKSNQEKGSTNTLNESYSPSNIENIFKSIPQSISQSLYQTSKLLVKPSASSTDDYLTLDPNFQFVTYFTVSVEPEKLDSLEVYTLLNYSDFGVVKDFSKYLWAIYVPENQEWISLNSEPIEYGIAFTFDSDQSEIPNIFTLTLVKLEESSLFSPTNLKIFWIILIGIVIVVLLFGILMSSQEYRHFLLNRVLHIDKGAHRLSMEDVLENENRNKIIEIVLYEPGVHFNEILRKTGLSAGNLAWHLDILETFKVVRKQRMGQYLVYYPYYEKNPVAKLDPAVQKSRTTLEIMQIIHDHPGIFQKQIAHRMDLDHKTVKYHIDKLLDAEIIVSEKKGRKTLYYPAQLINGE
ncbi:MAG: hypothetical protein DRO88_10610 [Promethearchaeia archaeon]|nr:MAG: hypothetical protein DRO88_10610 [Candidatus Lokiarchaeia archaeon]